MNVYLDFVDVTPDTRRTQIIEVRSRRTGVPLGQIRWYGQWRQYAMFPADATIWNPDCLDAVNLEIRRLMAGRHHGRVAARSYDQEAGGYGSPPRA